jgi:hypothetical protein
MPPQAPTSFIPKKPLDTGRQYNEPGGLGLLFFIALFVFVASLVGAGGVFAAKNFLAGSIADKSEQLAKAEGAFDLATVQDLIRMDARINNANTLLQNHVAPSALFAFLSQQTLVNVQFTSFDYTLTSGNSATVIMTGQGSSFSTVALQSDQFGASKLLKDVVFSNIKVGSSGTVTFNVAAAVDPALINYGKNLGNPAAVPQPSVPAAPAGTSPTPAR